MRRPPGSAIARCAGLLCVAALPLMVLATDAVSADDETAAAATAGNAFGIDLFKELAAGNPNDNLFLSPYSLFVTLSLTSAGARGRTEAEMKHVLHVPEGAEGFHAGIAALNRRFDVPADAAKIREQKAEIEKLRALQQRINQRIKDLWSDRDPKRQEIEKARKEEADIASRISELISRMDPTQLFLANALWMEKTCKIRKSFLELAAAHYNSAVHEADFIRGFELARGQINRWAEDATRERIRDLLPLGSVGPLTRLILTNAIYFKGEWKTSFSREKTRDEDFTLADGRKIKVPMMMHGHLKDARYAAFHADGSHAETPSRPTRDVEEGGFAMLELPYLGNRLSMIVIAPNSPQGLPAVEKMLDEEALAQWMGELERSEVMVFLPRWKVETGYVLNDALTRLGMGSAFRMAGANGGADFGGMVDTMHPENSLFIDLVLHKAFVEVNEEGTEAAAATAVTMTLGAGPMPAVFRADRPFLYLIRDIESGVILFLGRLANPVAQ